MQRLAGILIAITFLGAPAFAAAQTQSSQHYEVQQATLSGGANTTGSSANYAAATSLGEPTTGNSQSSSYTVQSGFNRTSTSSSGTSGSGSSGGTTNNTTSSASSGSISVPVTCSDPSALNYNPSTMVGNDSGCRYAPTALAATSTTAGATNAASSTRQLAAIAASIKNSTAPTASVTTAPLGATLTLNATQFQPGMPLRASVALSGAHASAAQTVIFSVIRTDGTVATTSTETVSESVVRHLFAPGALSAGSYTLHVRVIWASGTSTELNAPFTVATSSAYAVHGLWWGLLLLVLLGVVWWYQRRRTSEE